MSIIAKIDRVVDDLPVLRLPTGELAAGDPDALKVASEGNVVLLGTDNNWRRGSEKDWEPITSVGTVERVNGDTVLVQSALGVIHRSVPAGLTIEVGNTVTYDNRPELLDVIASDAIRPSLLDDDFNISSVKSTPKSKEWTDFAGFADIVQEARDLVAVHTNMDARNHLADIGVDPIRGILFDGPPGTGKTFLAQIMASQSHATFYLVTTAALGGRLVSESEQRLQRIYSDAAGEELSIVFVDEIDALTGHRGNDQDYGSRLVNVFLTNMDGVDAPHNVITIGTTNRVDSIDRALRRPGRFDRQVTFTHPNAEDRLAILRARRRKTAGDLDYATVAAATENWTAADLGAVWQHAGELTVIAGRNAIRNDYFLIGFERAATARNKRLIEAR